MLRLVCERAKVEDGQSLMVWNNLMNVKAYLHFASVTQWRSNLDTIFKLSFSQ